MMPLAGPQIFVASLLAAMMTFYAIVVVVRKQRFRSLSSRLDAAYVHAGWFGAGKVVGDNFAIEARLTRGGRGRTYRTYVQVAVPRLPGTYLLRTEFFERFPDWRFATTPGHATARAFGATISFQGYVETNPEQRRALIDWLRHCDVAQVQDSLKKLRIREIRLEQGHAIVTLPGAVTNAARIRAALNALFTLATLSPVR
jgi:hypothetical protein